MAGDQQQKDHRHHFVFAESLAPVFGLNQRGDQIVARFGSARGDEHVAARTVLWAAGVRASTLAASLGAPRDTSGRVEVLPDLSIPGHPEGAIDIFCEKTYGQVPQ